jgi:glycolate dehydrogenase FAD-binding subunit
MTAITLLRSLAEIVGPAHCLGGADLAPYGVDGRTPCGVVLPGSADEVARVVRAAAAAGVPVVPWGGGTQMSRGTPPRDGALVVGLRRLGRVLEHEPGDLTATAEAGITLDTLQAALGTRGQWLPLDPPAPGAATLGGVLAANTAGPRRQGYGTARDLVIGIRVVAADGQLVRAGGKVVKNVAGYDLVKLYIGSLGTLGIIVDATLKLNPRPEAEGACWATFPTLDAAAAAAASLAASELRPVALVLLDARAAEACASMAGLPTTAGPAVLMTFDGLARAVAWTGDEAARRLRAAGARSVDVLDAGGTARALEAVRETRRLLASPVAIATAGLLPADAGAYLGAAQASARAAGFELAGVAHAGHGLVTLVLAPGGAPRPAAATAAVLTEWRAAARARGGHLVVEWAPLGVREACPVWDPPGASVDLMRGLKARLDPQGVLNPGRFVGGI